jgi:hypothetical protein
VLIFFILFLFYPIDENQNVSCAKSIMFQELPVIGGGPGGRSGVVPDSGIFAVAIHGRGSNTAGKKVLRKKDVGCLDTDELIP